MVTASAPGKLFLLGEHAVVYGYPALIAALSTRIFVSSNVIEGNEDTIITPGISDTRFVRAAIALFKKKYNVTSSVTISTRADFSNKVGFGSSAAVTVATVASLAKLFKCNVSDDTIFNLSYSAVTEIQGVASGADVAACVYGGILYYQKEEKPIIKKVSDSHVLLIVGYSGVKANTVQMVNQVETKYSQEKEVIEKICTDISKLVTQGYEYLEHNNYEKFGECMNKNHIELQKLGVSTDILDKMVLAAVTNGAWGAKLSGAGGGDCMIAIGPQNKRKTIIDGIQNIGGTVIDVTISPHGVQII